MRAMRPLLATFGIVIFATLAILPAPVAGQARTQDDEEAREVYTGTLVGLGGALAGRSTTFTLILNGRVSRSAAGRYVELLRGKGQDALQKQLESADYGSFAMQGQTGRRVNFAFEQATPEGRRITLLWERWLQPFELRYGTRSQDYPFTYMELSIDNEGKGHGTLIGAAKVYFEKDDPGTLNVENFGAYPVRVINVEREK